MVVGDTPTGPWSDPLGKPLIPRGLTPVQERDPGILQDRDGANYIVFGTWDFYLARLNDDMISLAEAPRKIILDQKMGPYGPGRTDDKPFLHQRDGKYYLSWGCYYAMADNPYGPYVYKASVITKERTAPEFQRGLTMDRHGSFFEFQHQWYFICNDQSWPGTNPHFRDSVISYVHYRDNGEIEPVYLNRTGVGEYDAAQPRIEAEDYFNTSGTSEKETPDGGFEIRDTKDGSWAAYPHVMNLPANATVSLRVACGNPTGASIEVRAGDDPSATLLGICQIPDTGGWMGYRTLACKLRNPAGAADLCLVFRGGPGELARLNWFSLSSSTR